MSNTNDADAAPVQPIVMPFELTLENVLRRCETPFSLSIATDFTIGRNGCGRDWQVFYRGCDAAARLRLRRGGEHEPLYHSTFEEAWNWISRLSDDDFGVLETC